MAFFGYIEKIIYKIINRFKNITIIKTTDDKISETRKELSKLINLNDNNELIYNELKDLSKFETQKIFSENKQINKAIFLQLKEDLEQINEKIVSIEISKRKFNSINLLKNPIVDYPNIGNNINYLKLKNQEIKEQRDTFNTKQSENAKKHLNYQSLIKTHIEREEAIRQEQLKQEYEKYLIQARANIIKKNFERALEYFEKAIKISKNITNLQGVEKIVAQKNNTIQIIERIKKENYEIQEFIKIGDTYFRSSQFQKAIEQYEKALQVRNNNIYVKNKIKAVNDEVERIKETARKKAQEIQRKKELEKKYEQLVIKAKEYFENDQFKSAKELFEQANKIKLDTNFDEYISSCNIELEILKKKEEKKRKKYNELIQAGNNNLEVKSYEIARSYFKDAKLFCPEEDEPNIKIDKINRILKEQKEKKRLDKLITERKNNWREFEQVLKDNYITEFYHFTDISNIKSIKKSGGLYSWKYCNTRNIHIPRQGGDNMSRNLDMRYSLEDYTRLSFCNDHPMIYRLEQNGYNIVLLKIDIDVAYLSNTLFSDINATDSNHSHGGTLKYLKRVNFSATKKSYVSRTDPDFKPHQAEILVKTWIPLKYIKNINDF